MGWLKTLISFITDPIADLTGGYVERKRIAAEMAADVARAENNFKIAQFEAKSKRCMQAEQHDADYDFRVWQNRDKTIMEEVIILFFVGLFVCHFIPAMQPYMHKGWQSMGYQGAPWYFEFVIVGIAVSTLGLMRLFRAFWGSKNGNKKSAS